MGGMKRISAFEVNIAFINDPLIVGAESYLLGCHKCDQRSSLPFDYILDALTGCDPRFTEYLMYRLAQCPRCHGAINEKTLVAVE